MEQSVSAGNDLARLRWQCRRGMLELDILLGEFVDRHYTDLTQPEQGIFQEILTYPDQLLFDYFFGSGRPVDKEVDNVIKRIQQAVTPGA